MRSEFDFIKRIRSQAEKRQPRDLIFGIGDDAAVLREREGRETLVTVDLLVEDIDFKLEYAPSNLLGHKALAVSLSDIAAMGGKPEYSLLTLGVPKKLQISESQIFFENFFAGYFALAEKHSVSLIGGDISSTSDCLTIDSMVIGHCRAGEAVSRRGAKPGDAIYLSGTAGASAAGLKLLLGGARLNENEDNLFQSAIRAHLQPEPPVAFGQRIGEKGLATSMIDLSDGLAQDLLRICEESDVSAIVDFDSTPLAEEVELISNQPELAFDFAVNGGEDFELLLTTSRRSETELLEEAAHFGVKLTRVGEIVQVDSNQSRVLLSRNGKVKPMSIHGFDHFHI